MILLEVGRVIGLHGVRGKVKVRAYSGDPSGVLAAKTLRLSGGRGMAPGTIGEYEVATAQRVGGCAVFSLKGVDTLEAAEKLVRAIVSVRRRELPSLPEDEFYWIDAVGCLVVDEGGAPLGGGGRGGAGCGPRLAGCPAARGGGRVSPRRRGLPPQNRHGDATGGRLSARGVVTCGSTY